MVSIKIIQLCYYFVWLQYSLLLMRLMWSESNSIMYISSIHFQHKKPQNERIYDKYKKKTVESTPAP